MGNRDFSDAVKFEVVKNNLEKYGGEIHCESCRKKLVSISDCHFDHITPYAKGGQNTLENCQILCVDCNLKKTDKDLRDFILEEKARKFLSGELPDVIEQTPVEDISSTNTKLTKEEFDRIMGGFIKKKGDINKVDFGREYNHLPSIHYVHRFYGDLTTLKKAFGIEDSSLPWNRDTIKTALLQFLEAHSEILQKDLTKSNKLPSLPCILAYYPECKNFTDVKRVLCNLDVPDQWTVENAIEAGKRFISKHEKITEKDLHAKNHLPATKVIYNLFGTLGNFQEAIGCKRSQVNEFISKEEISIALEKFFGEKERIVESQQAFFKVFPYSASTICKRYGSFSKFCAEQNISVLNTKKAKYTKREVDDAISKWVKDGNQIPAVKDLTKLGLPSQSVILKYYEDWKEPFYLYVKIYEEVHRA